MTPLQWFIAGGFCAIAALYLAALVGIGLIFWFEDREIRSSTHLQWRTVIGISRGHVIVTAAVVTIMLYAIAEAPHCKDTRPISIGSVLKIRRC